MSFLQNLLNDKLAHLKPTETTVTRADGTRYIERHSSPPILDQHASTRFGFVVDTAPDDTPAKILPNLFIGAQDCCSPESIEKHQINYVLSVGIESPHKLSNIDYEFVNCLDLPETNLRPIIEHCNKIIGKCRNDEKNILIHCNAGVSRSSAIVLGYLILECGFCYEDAYQVLKTARPAIQPNSGFVKQLKSI